MDYALRFTHYSPVAPLGLWVCRGSALLYTCRPAGAIGRARRPTYGEDIGFHCQQMPQPNVDFGKLTYCRGRSPMGSGSKATCACPKRKQPSSHRVTTSFLIPIYRGVTPICSSGEAISFSSKMLPLSQVVQAQYSTHLTSCVPSLIPNGTDHRQSGVHILRERSDTVFDGIVLLSLRWV